MAAQLGRVMDNYTMQEEVAEATALLIEGG